MITGDDATLARMVYVIVLNEVTSIEPPLGALAARMRDEVLDHKWPPAITPIERGMLDAHNAWLTRHVTGRADAADVYAQVCRYALRHFNRIYSFPV